MIFPYRLLWFMFSFPAHFWVDYMPVLCIVSILCSTLIWVYVEVCWSFFTFIQPKKINFLNNKLALLIYLFVCFFFSRRYLILIDKINSTKSLFYFTHWSHTTRFWALGLVQFKLLINSHVFWIIIIKICNNNKK